MVSSTSISTVPAVNSETPLPDVSNAGGQPVALYRLPSSSRAYPLPFEQKAEAYRRMFSRFLD